MCRQPDLTSPEDEALRLDHQLCFPLYAAARRITGLYQPVLQPLGLTYTQYVTLLALWEQDGLSVSELGERLYLDSGTLTPLLKKLADRGLITRERAAEDERVVRIRLTEAGRALKASARDIPARVGACVPLSPEDAQALYALLYKILK